MSDKKELTAKEWIARYEAMLELTSQSVEDGEKLYTEKEMKERAWEAYFDATIGSMVHTPADAGFYKHEFEEWYNNKYSSDEAK